MTEPADGVAAALPTYEVGQLLGQGGYGRVHFGRHRHLGRPVAIKELPSMLARDPATRSRFIEEAHILASFDHPHIVRLYDYVERDELCLLVMEYLQGGSVGDVITGPGLGVEAACAIAMVTCAGLQYAHDHRVLHRDVKPENALYAAERVLKVTDFGIAKIIGGADVLATAAGELLGTPAYMAPEQAEGRELGPATDVYATGIMLYELLSGHLPYSEDGGGLAIIYRHVYEDPIELRTVAPQVPEPIADMVMRAIARAPQDRYPTAESFGVAVGETASRALGRGWLERSEVPLLSHGPILESARVSAGAPAPPPGGAGTTRVRGAGPRPRQPPADRLSASRLVPVRDVLPAPPSARRAVVVTFALLVAACLTAALWPRGSVGTVSSSHDAYIEQQAIEGEDVVVDLERLDEIDARIRPATPSRRRAELELTVAGIPLGEDASAVLSDGKATLDASAAEGLAVGIVDAELRIVRANRVRQAFDFRVEQQNVNHLLSLPGAATLGLLLFLLAYAEALLRPMRRAGRFNVIGLIAMGAIGAGGGVVINSVVWLLGLQPIEPLPVLLTAILGSAAGMVMAVASVQSGRRARYSAAARERSRRGDRD